MSPDVAVVAKVGNWAPGASQGEFVSGPFYVSSQPYTGPFPYFFPHPTFRESVDHGILLPTQCAVFCVHQPDSVQSCICGD